MALEVSNANSTVSKRRKRSHRFLEIKKSLPPTLPRAPNGGEGARTALSDREKVQLALAKFRELLKAQPHMTGAQVLKQMRTWHRSLLVNLTFVVFGDFGPVPGVEVGDCFSWRAELRLVGLHRNLQAGIQWKDVTELDWREDVRFRRLDGNKESIAISIVVSDGYEDNLDDGETLIYSGEGGKETGARKHNKDQTLDGGNSALSNNWIRKCPVRVIRGKPDLTRPSKKVYSYDGLYQVTERKREKGKSGFDVYKFTLVRESGQSPLNWAPSHRPSRTSQRVQNQEEEEVDEDITSEEEEEADEDITSEEEEEEDDADQEEEEADNSGANLGEYEVEQILEKRTGANKKTEYLVWWKTYPKDEATWEPIANLDNCLDLRIEFERTLANRH